MTTDAGKRLSNAMDAVAKMVETHGIDQRGGKKYVQVVHRVEQLRRAFDILARIETTIIDDDGERVLMKATVSIGEAVVGTGHAEEIRGVGYVNKTSAIENCETSAIGRALAACGLAGGEYASVNELDGVQRKERAQASKAPPRPGGHPMTEAEQMERGDNPSKTPPAATKVDAKEALKKRQTLAIATAYEQLTAANGDPVRLKKAEDWIRGEIEKTDDTPSVVNVRDGRMFLAEVLLVGEQWGEVESFLVKMENGRHLTKKQVAEYMERVDAGRGGGA